MKKSSLNLIALKKDDTIQRGDLFLDSDGKYLEIDKMGKILGVTCLGKPVKTSGLWFRPLKESGKN